jgi:hypothetical protein
MGSGDITKEYDKLDRILAELAEHRVILNGLANKVASIETSVVSLGSGARGRRWIYHTAFLHGVVDGNDHLLSRG